MSKLWSLITACLLGTCLGCAEPALELVGVRPVSRDIEESLATNGRIEATNRVDVYASVAGRVERVLARRGVVVTQGEELLRLADSGQSGAESQARARMDAALAGLAELDAGLEPAKQSELRAERSILAAARESARSDLERLERLVGRQAAPRIDLAEKKRSLADLQVRIDALDSRLAAPPPAGRREALVAAVREAELAWDEAQRAAARLSIVAPRGGSLYALPVTEGDFLSEGGLVARIGTVDRVRARVYVDEPELGRVGLGLVARLTADAYPGRSWDCEIDGLPTEVVELGSRRVGEALCTAGNPDGLLLPNLSVGVRIVTRSAERVLSLPRAAVQGRGADAFVWIMDRGRATRQPVSIGAEGTDFVEIREGLGGSETVVVPRGGGISEGQAVRVIVARSGANG